MSSERRPWYQWYPKDFVADEKVQALSPIAELVYRRTLDIMWQANDCRLPSNCLKLANALSKGLDKKTFEEAWSEIQFEGFELFKITDCGKWIYSKRLVEQIKRIDKLSKTRSKAGKKGVQAKASAKAKQKSSKCQANATSKRKQSTSDTDTDTDSKKNTSREVAGATAPPFKYPSQDQLDNYSIVKLGKEIDAICKELYDKKIFPDVHKFKNTMLKRKGNERAVLHVLIKCLMKREFEKGPWAYCQKIMSVENGNYNESDYQKTA